MQEKGTHLYDSEFEDVGDVEFTLTYGRFAEFQMEGNRARAVGVGRHSSTRELTLEER